MLGLCGFSRRHFSAGVLIVDELSNLKCRRVAKTATLRYQLYAWIGGCRRNATLYRTAALAFYACIAYNACMQYTIRKVSDTLDAALRRSAREQGKSLNEVATEAMARGAGLAGRAVRLRDLHDIAGTWREDRTFARTRAAHEAIEAELWR